MSSEVALGGSASAAPHDDLLAGELTGVSVTALAWTASGRLVQHAAAVAGVAVLARMLAPADFGLLAMAAVFTGFAAVFVDLGLTAALVQRPELTERHRSTAFWVNAGTALLLGLALAALAPLVAAIYDEPRLVGITVALAASLPLAGLGAVQTGLAERRMDFRRLAVIESGAVVLSFAAAIGAAWAGAGVWSLVVQALTQAGARSLGLWLSTSWWPRQRPDRESARELLAYGGHLAGYNATWYWIRSVDQLAVGVGAGAGPLGLYSRAYQLMLLPLSQVTWVSGRVMFPALSRLGDAVERIRSAYLRAVRLIAFVTFPLTVVLFVVAEPLVLTLLGGQWQGAIEIFRILCVVGLLQTVTATAGWIYQARGRTDWMFRWGLANAAVTVTAVVIGVQWGAVGVAVAYAVRTVLLAPPALAIPGRLIGMSLGDVVRSLQGIALAAAATAVPVAACEVAARRSLAAPAPSPRPRSRSCRLSRRSRGASGSKPGES